MAVDFVPDPTFEKMLLSSPELEQHLRGVVDEAARRAADLAPDDPSTGAPDLHSSIFGDVEQAGPTLRGRVGATDYKARWFEEGATGVPARPFLRPAVEEKIGPLGPDTGEPA